MNDASPSAPRLEIRAVLAIALPMMLANVSPPLIGAVDTAIIGQSGEPHLIGAVALGAMIFTLLSWSFGFLRMSTAGLGAQAEGAGDAAESAAVLARAFIIAAIAGLAIILLQGLLAHLIFWAIDGSPTLKAEARLFYDIRIWGAPAAFANYALMGWFLGLGRARTALLLQLGLNSLNLALNILFVIGFGWGVAGVAAGALIAEIAAAGAGLAVAWRIMRGRGKRPSLDQILSAARLKRLFIVNSDIMIRTLCLLAAFSFFTVQGAKAGDVTLAANAILLHFFHISAYLLDGFESAAQTLTGHAVGAASLSRFRRVLQLTLIWSAGLSLLLAAAVWLAGPWVIGLMTTSEAVQQEALRFLPWAAATPVAGFLCFQLDGVFIGATRTADMRNMMAASLVLYLAAWAVLTPTFANHGLWAAMIVFFLARAVTLGLRLPALERAAFGQSDYNEAQRLASRPHASPREDKPSFSK